MLCGLGVEEHDGGVVPVETGHGVGTHCGLNSRILTDWYVPFLHNAIGRGGNPEHILAQHRICNEQQARAARDDIGCVEIHDWKNVAESAHRKQRSTRCG